MKLGSRTLVTRIRLAGLAAATLLGVVVLAAAVRWLLHWPAAVWLATAALVALVAARQFDRRVPRGTVLELDLDRGVVESHGSDPISKAATIGALLARDVVDALDRAAIDNRVEAVVARIGNGRIELGHAQEIRDALERFRASGKKAVAFAEAFGESGPATIDYYLASAFSEIHLMPYGEAAITGLLAKGRFVHGLLEKLGVVVELDHREEYKSALYTMTEDRFNEPHREELTALRADQFQQVIAGIAGSRGLSEARVRELIDTSPHRADDARREGLVDHLGYRDDAHRAAGGDAHLIADRYLQKAGRPNRRGAVVALVHGVGTIHRGSSRFDPLGRGPSFGADDVSSALRQAVDDSKVEAIVLRVDSHGGTGVASELVRHEVQRAIEAGTPVVVSMGNVATSGGYWVACHASHIVAQPGTVTGSIGVVGGKLVTGPAWAKLGITSDQVEFGRRASFASSSTPFTEDEREAFDESIDLAYRDFVDLVATGRDLDGARAMEIAKGRAWTGSQAEELGLVDSLGGLDRALDEARQLAGLGPTCKVRPFPKAGTFPLRRLRRSSDPTLTALSSAIDSLRNYRQVAGSVQAIWGPGAPPGH